MKYRTIFCLGGAIVAFFLIDLLLKNVLDLCTQYDAFAYLSTSLSSGAAQGAYQIRPADSAFQDRVIVMAALEQEDTSWVANELPDWRSAIYIVNPSDASAHTLTAPMNKGREAMAYLTYIIDNYNSSISSVVAFLHSHRRGFFNAWHVDAPLHDNVVAMRTLQLNFVKENGYVNLRCNLNPGCSSGRTEKNAHLTREVWEEIFDGTSAMGSTVASNDTQIREAVASQHSHQRNAFPQMGIAAACCAQFAVSREQILRRPLMDYVKFRQWIIETDKDDAHSGRVMEYLWHVIFGKDTIYCPHQDTCYCQVYGRC